MLAVALVALVLANPEPSPATTAAPTFPSPTGAPLALAIQRAEQFWGGAPCGGQFSVAIDDVPASIGYTAGCAIHLQQRFFGTSSEQAAAWPQFCRALTHEMGHAVLGPYFFARWNPSDPGHSPSLRSVMYFTDPAYPTTCFPATLEDGGLTYRFRLRHPNHRWLISWVTERRGQVVGRGLVAHVAQPPWYRPRGSSATS